MGSYLFPAYLMGKVPESKLIVGSHTAELAQRFGRMIRNLVAEDRYLELFPNFALSADSKAAGRWDTNHGGEAFFIGKGGAMTGRGGPGTADIKFAIAVPVYSFDAGTVQVLSLTQKSILKELDQISQMEDYAELLAWDFQLSKKGSGLLTEYTLRPVPRKKGAQEHIDAAWLEAKSNGFDISRLLTGGNPFKAA